MGGFVFVVYKQTTYLHQPPRMRRDAEGQEQCLGGRRPQQSVDLWCGVVWWVGGSAYFFDRKIGRRSVAWCGVWGWVGYFLGGEVGVTMGWGGGREGVGRGKGRTGGVCGGGGRGYEGAHDTFNQPTA